MLPPHRGDPVKRLATGVRAVGIAARPGPRRAGQGAAAPGPQERRCRGNSGVLTWGSACSRPPAWPTPSRRSGGSGRERCPVSAPAISAELARQVRTSRHGSGPRRPDLRCSRRYREAALGRSVDDLTTVELMLPPRRVSGSGLWSGRLPGAEEPEASGCACEQRVDEGLDDVQCLVEGEGGEPRRGASAR